MSTLSHPLAARAAWLYDLLVTVTNHLQSPFLYVIRFVFGIELMQAGVGRQGIGYGCHWVQVTTE